LQHPFVDRIDSRSDARPIGVVRIIAQYVEQRGDNRRGLQRAMRPDNVPRLQPYFAVAHHRPRLCALDRFGQTISIDEVTTFIVGIRPRAAAYKRFDQGGLHLYVVPTGRMSFRMKFSLDGKEQLLTIGAVAEVSLDAARARCDQAREQLGRGVDPRTTDAAPAGRARAFEHGARQWHAHKHRRWTDVHAADVLASLERDAFPALGAMPISVVTVPVILNALRGIEARGSLETARRVRQRMSAVFAYAMAEDLVD
jgi:hypothetical protein